MPDNRLVPLGLSAARKVSSSMFIDSLETFEFVAPVGESQDSVVNTGLVPEFTGAVRVCSTAWAALEAFGTGRGANIKGLVQSPVPATMVTAEQLAGHVERHPLSTLKAQCPGQLEF